MSTVPPKSRFQLREKKLDKIEMAPIIDVNNLLLIFFFCIGGKQEKAKQNFEKQDETSSSAGKNGVRSRRDGSFWGGGWHEVTPPHKRWHLYYDESGELWEWLKDEEENPANHV